MPDWHVTKHNAFASRYPFLGAKWIFHNQSLCKPECAAPEAPCCCTFCLTQCGAVSVIDQSRPRGFCCSGTRRLRSKHGFARLVEQQEFGSHQNDRRIADRFDASVPAYKRRDCGSYHQHRRGARRGPSARVQSSYKAECESMREDNSEGHQGATDGMQRVNRGMGDGPARRSRLEIWSLASGEALQVRSGRVRR